MTRFVRSSAFALIACAGAALLVPASVFGQAIPLGSPIPQQPVGTLSDDASLYGGEFLAYQLAFPRVEQARATTDERLRRTFEEKGIAYPANEIFIRVFKHERQLELWARSNPESDFALVVRYPVCVLPGQLGPKERMGDVQVPEGFYFIDGFNPRSTYHLSLRVNYPNLADRMRRQVRALGGDIYIHGGCESVGCVPIEDDNIAELYWVAAQASEAGQSVIPVHIFPTRLDPDRLQWLQDTFRPDTELLDFWRNLAEGYAYFETTRRVPWVTVAEDGRYTIPEPPRHAHGLPAGGDR